MKFVGDIIEKKLKSSTVFQQLVHTVDVAILEITKTCVTVAALYKATESLMKAVESQQKMLLELQAKQ